MRFVLIFALLLLIGGCVTDGGGNNLADDIVQSTVFARPKIIYHTGDNLEVSYLNGGIQQSYNERTAMDLLKQECGGAFRITGRSDSANGGSYVDAVCVR